MELTTLGPCRYIFEAGVISDEAGTARALPSDVRDCIRNILHSIETVGLEVILERIENVCFFEECSAQIHILQEPNYISILRITLI